MGRYKLIVMSRPIEGREAEFNDWYTNEHLADVVAIPGFSSAQRFKLHASVAGQAFEPYLAIYEMDGDTPQDAVAALMERSSSGQMPISDAMDQAVVCAVFEAYSPLVVAST